MQKTKIHLGCGSNIFQGWDNYDYLPAPGAYFIDLTKPLEFDSNSVDFIFFEHTLEHFDEVDGYNLLKQFFRVLKNGGVARIITPSLDTYVERFSNWQSDINSGHRRQFNSETQFLNYAFFGENVTKGIKFMNNMNSCEIGHKFIYSKKDIIEKCKNLNFKDVYLCDYRISKFEELNNRETRPDYKDIILEIIK